MIGSAVPVAAIFFAASVFGFWLTGQDFFIVPGKCAHPRLIRAVYTVPYSILCTAVVIGFLTAVQAIVLGGEKFDALYDGPGLYLMIAEALVIDCVLIVLYKKHVIPKESPAELSERYDDAGLFLFVPAGDDFLIDRPSERGKTTYDIIESFTADPVRLDLKMYDTKNMNALYGTGELIFRKDAADILIQNQLTGFTLIPVRDQHRKEYVPEMPYFRLSITKKMPAADERTVFDVKKYSVRIRGMKVFYKRSDIGNCSDFSRMKENTGYVEHDFCGKIIVTAKAMKVLTSQIGFGKRDFVPVHIIEDM